jgi:hypothetical protein
LIFCNFRCDADPSALARYVLALLKKNKPQEELSSCMAEQLDVFLGSGEFLNIKSWEYLLISISISRNGFFFGKTL